MESKALNYLSELLTNYYAADERTALCLADDIMTCLDGLIGWRLQQERLSQEATEEFHQRSRIAIFERLQSSRNSGNPIDNLAGYAVTVVRNLVAEEKRKSTPRRRMTQRLRYIVNQSLYKDRFALWRLLNMTLIGLKDRAGQPCVETERYLAFKRNTEFFVQDGLNGQDPEQIELWELLLKFMEWIQTPLDEGTLVEHLLELQPIKLPDTASLDQLPIEEVPMTLVVETKRDWDACWQAICDLPPRNRAALLLKFQPDMLEFLTGQAAPQQALSELLGIPLEEMQPIWDALPLEDDEIARRLNTTPSNVQVMRSRCRRQIAKIVGLPPLF